MKALRVTTGVGVLLAAVLLVACGDSDSSDTSTSSASSTSTPSNVKFVGAPIKVMQVGAETSAVPTSVSPEATDAAKARAAAINAAGGINGHKLELQTCDTQVDPNKAGDCARKAIADGVVALVGVPGVEMAQLYPLIEKAGLASIGAVPAVPFIGDSPVALCFTSAVPGELIALPTLLKQNGANVQSAVYPGDIGPGTALIEQTFTEGVKKANAKIGALSTFSAKSTEFAAAVAKALTPETQGILSFDAGAPQGPLIATIQQQNPKVKIAAPNSTLTPEVLKFLGGKANGVLAAGFGMPATSSAPGIKLFNADMDKYASKAQKDDLSINAWSAVWAFERIAKDLKTVDRASVLRATKNLTDFDMGGIYPPLNSKEPFTGFPGMKCAAAHDTVLETVKDGQLHAVQDGQFTDPFQ